VIATPVFVASGSAPRSARLRSLRCRVASRPDAESGFTLVELLVTLAIMAIAFVVIMSGIGVFSQSTRIHRSTAELDSALRTYVERLASATYDATCPTSYSAVAVPSGFTAALAIRYWNGNTAPAGYVTTCPATDKGTQQITVTLTQTSTGVQDRLTFVKRQP
jgi:prepilin-type N-terminal cleavage/methylation domain-containing protein